MGEDRKILILPHIRNHIYPYIVLALILLFYLPVIRGLIFDWARDANYSHGFLIVPVSVYMFYRKRQELRFPAKSSPWGAALIIAGSSLMILASAAAEYFTIRCALVITLTGLTFYYLGWDNFKKVWFSFFILLFMIPLPAIIYYSATFPMQLFSSKITNDILQLIGISSLRYGNIIKLPNYTLEVAEACSGLRGLVTLMSLGALYGNLTLPGRVRPLLLFVATIPIAIAANIARLFITVVVAYAISTRLADDFLHQLSGVIVFVVALILTIFLGGILRWERKRS